MTRQEFELMAGIVVELVILAIIAIVWKLA
jgi:hypothetical protein